MDGRNRDMEGLEAVNDANLPEVMYSGTSRRGNSVRSPEPLMNSSIDSQEKDQAQSEASARFYRDNEADYAHVAPYQDPTPLEFGHSARKKKRICGLSRRLFIIAAALVIIIVLAAILGGVLGTVLKDSSDPDMTNPPSETISQSSPNENSPVDKTGTALLVPASGASIFAYYSTSDALVEVEYRNGVSSNGPITTVVIARNAKSTSPLAAIEVTPPGSSVYRTVFYLDNDNLLNFVNTTLGSGWSEPHTIFDDLVVEDNTRALAAVATSGGDEWRTGMRIYFGSSSGNIQEIGLTFGTLDWQNIWHEWRTFEGSDPKAGVASVVVNDENHLYLRNSSTGALQQLLWDYTQDNTTTWRNGITSTSSDGMAEGGSIAVASRARGTDYVFYHAANGSAVGAFCSGMSCSDVAPGIESLAKASVGYSLAATIADGTALVMNQDREMAVNLLLSSVTRDGVSNSTTFTPVAV